MRFIPFLCFFIILFSINLSGQNQANEGSYPLHTDDEIRARLAKINNRVVPTRFDGVVRSYVKTYTVIRREKTEAMLGRAAIYFPLFEKLLAENDMPLDLKFLSIVESALNPLATSRVGAAGLWQFMPATGKEYGLKVNRYVDERRDPEKATLAAIKYLKRQYKKFGSWELALAAYNGGPGRVNRAVKRGRSKNFWRIRKYLPRETRNYVPAYIAATYIANFYHMHDLMPLYPDLDLQVTEMAKVYGSLNFSEIEAITGTPEYIIEILNPSYKRNFIPANSRGSNLVLPKAKMVIFKDYYRAPDSGRQSGLSGESIAAPKKSMKSKIPINAVRTVYNVKAGDQLNDLARSFYCTETDIMVWNRLTSRQLRQGQELVVYISHESRPKVEPVEEIAGIPENAGSQNSRYVKLQPVPLRVKEKKYKSSKKKWRKRDNSFLYHKIKRGESLNDIADQYSIPVKDLLTLNEIKVHQALKPGKRIKVRKK